MKSEWTLAELAEDVGLPARTIRYYIARGLLDGPEVAGRGAVYSNRHVERLKEIRKLQREGRMLAEIAQASHRPVELPEPEAWWRYSLADGVVVELRGDLAPWRVKRIRKALSEAMTHLKEEDTDGNMRV